MKKKTQTEENLRQLFGAVFVDKYTVAFEHRSERPEMKADGEIIDKRLSVVSVIIGLLLIAFLTCNNIVLSWRDRRS